MSTCEMLAVIREAHGDRRSARQDRRELLVGDLRALLALAARRPAAAGPDGRAGAGLLPADRPGPGPGGSPRRRTRKGFPHTRYRWSSRGPVRPSSRWRGSRCRGSSSRGRSCSSQRRSRSSRAAAAAGRQGARCRRPGNRSPGASSRHREAGRRSRRPSAGRHGPAAAGAATRRSGPAKSPPALNFPKPAPQLERLQLANWAQVATAADRAKDADRRADRFAVEVHKKWSISFACISFVIVGIVMALRFPRGGIGLVIGGGMLVFSIHYVGLTAGESLADRGLLSPWLAMWAPNIVLTVLGLIGLLRVSRESGSTRGGDFQEVLDAHPAPVPPSAPAAGRLRRERQRVMIGVRTLDRYVFSSWLRIFILTALGFPLVSILINLTDTLNKLLDRGLTMQQIVVSYVYSIPGERLHRDAGGGAVRHGVHGRRDGTALGAHGGQGRRAELLPADGADLRGRGAWRRCWRSSWARWRRAPRRASSRSRRRSRPGAPRARYNFVYRGDAGWVYTVRSLDVGTRQLKQLLLERQGNGAEYPGLIITADSASYDDRRGTWKVKNGTSRVIAGPGQQASFGFRTMRLRALTQSPADLLAEPKAPDEMRYAELGRYIDALKRSGNDANKLIVEQALKLALPATCLIIALFGAPLAVQAPRAGAAVGIAISLGTTVIFLLLTQIMKAVGAGGVIDPTAGGMAAESGVSGGGLVLLARVRT